MAPQMPPEQTMQAQPQAQPQPAPMPAQGQVAEAQQQPQGQPQLKGPQGPQLKRDYKANPLNKNDKEQLDMFVAEATEIINGEKSRDMILGRIGGKVHPFKDIASASNAVAQKIEMAAEKQGKPIDDAVATIGLAHIIKQIGELANAAGKLSRPPASEDMRIMLAQAVKQRKGVDMQKTGQKPEMVSDEIYDLQRSHFQKQGKNMAGLNQAIALNMEAMKESEQREMPAGNRKPMTVAQKLGVGGLL